MAHYTIKNLRTDVEDSASRFGSGPDLEAHFATPSLELTQSAVSYQRLGPGFRFPFGHKHNEQEELYVVIEGSARIKLDDEVIDLSELDALRIPPEVMRCIEGGPDGVALLAFGAPKTGASPGDDAEVVPEWWSD